MPGTQFSSGKACLAATEKQPIQVIFFCDSRFTIPRFKRHVAAMYLIPTSLA
jgi:hypothetical protein